MGLFAIKLPDVGEGIAEAEIVEWNVVVGDVVREDDVLAVVMTDKANIEIPSSVSGEVVWLGGQVGDILAIGADLIRLEIAGDGNMAAHADVETPRAKLEAHATPATEAAAKPPAPDPAPVANAPSTPANTTSRPLASPMPARREGDKPLAAPTVRRRARDAGVDLRHVAGTGPAARITHQDLDAYLAHGPGTTNGVRPFKDTSVQQIRIVGLRRRIAEKMVLSNAIPHITIVEEVDVTNLQDLRAELNAAHEGTRQRLTILPFVMKAIVEAVREQPEMNAHFDADAGVISQYGGIHIGIATQTPTGLTVPVARHVEVNSLWDSAGEVARLAAAAREGTAAREELSGSTITITSLGPLGAIASTPIINHPEVAIVGINKMAVRPSWDGQQFRPRTMMNISCSFDHRVIDGWNAAVFVQKLKTLLEKPAMLFVER